MYDNIVCTDHYSVQVWIKFPSANETLVNLKINH
jgi:hypothetical protein